MATILESALVFSRTPSSPARLPQTEAHFCVSWGPEIQLAPWPSSHPIRRSKKNSAPTSTWTWSAATHLRTRRSSTSPAPLVSSQRRPPTWAHPSQHHHQTAARDYGRRRRLPQRRWSVEIRAGAASALRNELIADVTPYSEGSDHDDYDSPTHRCSFTLCLRDWPDIRSLSTPTTTASLQISTLNEITTRCLARRRLDMSTHQSTASCCHKLCRIWPRRATSV